MRWLGTVVAALTLIAIASCGSDDSSRFAPTTGSPPPSTTPLVRVPEVRAFRRRMAAACRRTRREIGSSSIASMSDLAAQARVESTAYGRLLRRLDRLVKPQPVIRPTHSYMRYVAGAIELSRQIGDRAGRQQARQVRRLARELAVNADLRDTIADRLRVDAC